MNLILLWRKFSGACIECGCRKLSYAMIVDVFGTDDWCQAFCKKCMNLRPSKDKGLH